MGVFLSSFRHACQAQLMGAISKCVADALKLGKGRIDYSIKYRRIRCEGPFEMVSWSQHVKLAKLVGVACLYVVMVNFKT